MQRGLAHVWWWLGIIGLWLCATFHPAWAASSKSGGDTLFVIPVAEGYPMLFAGPNAHAAIDNAAARLREIYPEGDVPKEVWDSWATRMKARASGAMTLAEYRQKNPKAPMFGMQANTVEDYLSKEDYPTGGIAHRMDDPDAFRASYRVEYFNKVNAQGGRGLFMAPGSSKEHMALFVREIDALVLLGGDDLHPDSQKSAIRRGVERAIVRGASRIGLGAHVAKLEPKPNPRANFLMDRYEQSLFRMARRSDLPILAICHGLQVAWSAMGGRVHYTVKGHGTGQVDQGETPNRPIMLNGDSELAEVMLEDEVSPQHDHSGAVDAPEHVRWRDKLVRRGARGLEVQGRDKADGTPEVVGYRHGRRGFFGLQFHAERSAGWEPLFEHLAGRAQAVRERREQPKPTPIWRQMPSGASRRGTVVSALPRGSRSP
jgi:gamma-glutamyl-gamma-aminobutyrate hydrolase PuuD